MAGLYFPHDFTASGDSKIVKLRRALGWEGYGIYWALIEKLASESSHVLATDYDDLGYDLRCDAGKLKRVVCDFGLFILAEDSSSFYSERLTEQLKKLDTNREKRRNAANARWSKNANNDDCNANAMQMHNQRDANAMHMQAKTYAERKKDNIREDNINVVVGGIGNTTRTRTITEDSLATTSTPPTITEDYSATSTTHKKSTFPPIPKSTQKTQPDAQQFEYWREGEYSYTQDFLALLDAIGAKFNLCDGRVYARQLEMLLKEYQQDGIGIVRGALAKLDTAEFIKSGRFKVTAPRFLTQDFIAKITGGSYDEVYHNSNSKTKNQWKDAGLSFENMTY